jgi:hypothetical protein
VPRGDQFDLDLAGDHLSLGFRIGTDVAGDDGLDQFGVDQATNADAAARRVVGDHRKVLASLADQFVDDPMQCSNPHEAADQEDAPSGIISTALATAIALFICVPPEPDAAPGHGRWRRFPALPCYLVCRSMVVLQERFENVLRQDCA